MNKQDFIEKVLGGIFAVIAVIAAIMEMFLAGVSYSTLLSCAKDVFGTLAVVVLFFAVMKNILPHWKFEDKLRATLEEWQEDNSNMIVRKPEHDNGENNKVYYSLDMKTEVADFYNTESHKKTGLFVRLPVIDKNNYNVKFEITFTMNKGTFFGGIAESELSSEDYKTIATRFIELINAKFQGIANAKYSKAKTITVTFSNGLHTKSDIDTFIDVINTMYTAYLVSARLKSKNIKES